VCVWLSLTQAHARTHSHRMPISFRTVARQRYQLVVFVRVREWSSKCGSKTKLQLTRHRNAPSTSILLCPTTVAWCAGALDTAARGCAGLSAGGGGSGKRGLARLMTTLCNVVAVAAFSSTGCVVAATTLGDLPHSSHLRGRMLAITPYSIRLRSKVQGRDNLQILLSPSRWPAAIMPAPIQVDRRGVSCCHLL
jgi:hypothetical protein